MSGACGREVERAVWEKRSVGKGHTKKCGKGRSGVKMVKLSGDEVEKMKRKIEQKTTPMVWIRKVEKARGVKP